MRNLSILLVGLLLLASASATFFVVKPVDRQVEAGDILEAGKMAPGQSFALHVEKKSGLGFKWTNLETGADVPTDWKITVDDQPETFVVRIQSPANASIGDHVLPLELYSPDGERSTLEVGVSILPPTVVATVSIESLTPEPHLNEAVNYRLIINNDSLGDESVSVTSNLQDYWFKPVSVQLAPGEKAERMLVVLPRAQGERQLEFHVISQKTALDETFFFTQTVPPGVPESFYNPFFGYNFFSPMLSGYYWIDSVLAAWK